MQRWRGRWRELTAGTAALERWLLPGACLSCAGPAGADDPLICDLCRRRWRAVTSPWCERCGQPGPAGIPCRLCPEWPEALVRARSA
ncbi:MAG TPA: double zinc ribbon domain-containing protein, partial [Gemmatimonadales bacterium]|nr:double zinc ribbon domain-containing protein [Gemmatimonadales bacterium]